jgi:D-alanyl-D-alanine carboxypeptidase
MNSTFYGNPTGLPASAKVFDNSAAPSDLLTLTLEMLQYDEILRVTGMGYADISNGRNTSVIRNHNHLTIDFKGEVDGMKTGYTKRAGFCLVATSNKCGRRLISIVLGSRSPELRNTVVKDMINDYYCAIGLDKLGPYCEAPSNLNAANTPSDDFVYRTKTVKKIHVVKHGEDLAAIAYQFNCSVADLKSWNKLRSGRVMPGKKLAIVSTITEKVPVAKSNEEDTEGSSELSSSEENSTQNQPAATETKAKAVTKTPVKTTAVVQPKSKYIIYVVQPGDTLSSIAKRYDISSVAQLKAVNKIPNGHMLKVGAKIRVPVSS